MYKYNIKQVMKRLEKGLTRRQLIKLLSAKKETCNISVAFPELDKCISEFFTTCDDMFDKVPTKLIEHNNINSNTAKIEKKVNEVIDYLDRG